MVVDGQQAIRASFSRAEEALRSLRESAAPARAIEETAQRLLAVEADQAASVEELRATCETLAAHAEEGLTAARQANDRDSEQHLMELAAAAKRQMG